MVEHLCIRPPDRILQDYAGNFQPKMWITGITSLLNRHRCRHSAEPPTVLFFVHRGCHSEQNRPQPDRGRRSRRTCGCTLPLWNPTPNTARAFAAERSTAQAAVKSLPQPAPGNSPAAARPRQNPLPDKTSKRFGSKLGPPAQPRWLQPAVVRQTSQAKAMNRIQLPAHSHPLQSSRSPPPKPPPEQPQTQSPHRSALPPA
jgi:hypothetical protein